jgi:hypothetical protein
MCTRRLVLAVLLAALLAPLAAVADEASPPLTDDTALYVRALELAVGADTLVLGPSSLAGVGRGGSLPAGRPAFVGISYATAFAYTMLTLRGVVHGMNDDWFRGLMIAVPTATAVGSYFLWDALEWKAARSGFMALVSPGGALAGFFVSGILDYAVGGLDPQAVSGIVLAGAVGGRATMERPRWLSAPDPAVPAARVTRFRPGPRPPFPRPPCCGTAPSPGAPAPV